MPSRLLTVARDFRPELVLVAKGETIHGETLKQIRKDQRCRIVNWFPDSRVFGYHRVIEQLPVLDLFFSKSALDVERCRLIGLSNARFLQHCADRELHVELQTSEQELKPYRCQLSVVGSFYPYRDQILQNVSDFDLRVWGPGWKQSGLYKRNPRTIVGRDARSFDQAKVFRATDVNLNTHHYDDIDQLNQRVFDIAGSGGCQIADGYRQFGPIFDSSSDILTYKSLEELRSVIRFLLDRPEVRHRMGESCRRKVAEAHTYDHRVQEILNMLGF